MSPLEVALSCIKRGWFVFPCVPKTKKPLTKQGFKDASNSRDTVEQWWASYPDANVAIATGPSGLTVVDYDHGLAGVADFADLETGRTYTVRTGRTDGFGVQQYFQGGGLKSTGWEQGDLKGDIRSATGYVMAAGCIHPSGEPYTVLVDAPLLPVPDWVRTLAPAHETFDPATAVEDTTADEWKTWLLEYAAHNQIGLRDYEKRVPNGWWLGVECPWGDEHASGPGVESSTVLGTLDGKLAFECSHGTCKAKKRDTAAFRDEMSRRNKTPFKPEPGADPVIVMGSGNKQPVEVDLTLDMPVQSKQARPVYPLDVWDGTPYGEFAQLSSAQNKVPPKMFLETFRTVVGAIVGDRLRSDFYGFSPRAYTVRIAPQGTGKGTADGFVKHFFKDQWDGLTRSGEGPLIWAKRDVHDWQSRGLGAQIVSAASAPGLMVAITPRKISKKETRNPLEEWKPIPRVITIAEELRSLFANFQNESTGAGLESVLCELFDSTEFTATATKDRPPESGELMYSMCGGITPAGWDGVFSKVGSTESGFLSRLNIVGTEQTETVSALRKPDYSSLKRRFLPMLASLEQKEVVLNPSDEALHFVEEWFHGVQLSEGIPKARLNIHAWRWALHLAWLKGHSRIELPDAQGGSRCADYLGKMREWYAPPEGETRAARAEAAIRKVMRERRRETVRKLKAATHSTKISVQDWDKALAALVKGGEMRLDVSPQGKKTVILLREED